MRLAGGRARTAGGVAGHELKIVKWVHKVHALVAHERFHTRTQL
jgi:hypothetical protein